MDLSDHQANIMAKQAYAIFRGSFRMGGDDAFQAPPAWENLTARERRALWETLKIGAALTPPAPR